jgi:hypothetical protein
MIKNEGISDTLKAIDEHIKKEYLKNKPEGKGDWRTYGCGADKKGNKVT